MTFWENSDGRHVFIVKDLVLLIGSTIKFYPDLAKNSNLLCQHRL